MHDPVWNIVDLLFGIWILFHLVGGLAKGFTWQLVRLVFLIAGFVVAHEYCGHLSLGLRDLTNGKLEPPVDRVLAFSLIFIAVYLGSWPIAALLRAVMSKLELRSFDRFLGGILGVVKGALVSYVAFLILAFFVPRAYPDGSRLEVQLRGSYSFAAVRSVDPVVREVFPGEFHAVLEDLGQRHEPQSAEEPPGGETVAVPPPGVGPSEGGESDMQPGREGTPEPPAPAQVPPPEKVSTAGRKI